MGCAAIGPSVSEGEDLGGADAFYEKYELGGKLGAGSCGHVRDCWIRSTREPRAVKVLDLRARSEPSAVRIARHEASVWRIANGSTGRGVGHLYVVRLFAAFLDQGFGFLVMERCECTVMQRLASESAGVILESDLARILRMMLLGLEHIHNIQVVHRDIKPDNFLFGGDDGQTVKLSDFGLAVNLSERPHGAASASGGALTGVHGTGPFMSPEMAGGLGHGLKTDCWSMGASAYLMLYGDFPYMPEEWVPEAMRALIISGNPPPSYRPFDPSLPLPSMAAESFVRMLLVRSPAQRCSAETALDTPFIKDPSSHAAGAPVAPAISRRGRDLELRSMDRNKLQRTIDEVLRRLSSQTRRGARSLSDEPRPRPEALMVVPEDGERRAARAATDMQQQRIKLGEFGVSDATTAWGSSTTSFSSSSGGEAAASPSSRLSPRHTSTSDCRPTFDSEDDDWANLPGMTSLYMLE